MECNPEGLSVLGYPILSDYAYFSRASSCIVGGNAYFQKRRSALPVTAGLLTSRREGSRELLGGRVAGVRPQRNRRQSDDPIPSFRAGE